MKIKRASVLACGAVLLLVLLELCLSDDRRQERIGSAPGAIWPKSSGKPPEDNGWMPEKNNPRRGIEVWTAPRVGAARRIIVRFFTALAQKNFGEAAACLHPEMDRDFFSLLCRRLKRLTLLSVGPPSFHPDGESVFFPVLLCTVVEEGAPAGWETGIATHYVRLRPVNGEPRLAEIAEGP